MAATAVKILIKKLASLLEQEVRLLMGFKDEVVSFRRDLEVMMVSLEEYDGKEDSDNNEALKTWLGQVREAAYEAADFFDELKFRLHNNRRWGHGFSFGFDNSLNVLDLHEMAVQQLRVQRTLREALDRRERFKSLISIAGAGGSSSPSSGSKYLNSQQKALLLSEDSIVGFEKPKEELISLLVEGNDSDQASCQLKVISVYGMGGLGKTTLAKLISDDPKVKNRFQVIYFFTINKPFNINEFVKDMLLTLSVAANKDIPQAMETTMKTDLIIKRIRELLLQGSYLLIFDDVGGTQAWDDISSVLPKGSQGRVLVTTRIEEVANVSHTAFNGYKYPLDLLSFEFSMNLFCKKLYRGDPQRSLPPHKLDITKKILNKCGGLPLAISAVTGLLSHKNYDQWDRIYRRLGAQIQDDKTLRSHLSNVLSLSFTDLNHSVKSCYLYLSIFPEGYPIEYNRLIRLLVAEGFVESKGEGITLEEAADEYLMEMLNRSLLQVAERSSEGRVKVIRVHGIFREIIISRSRERNLAFIASPDHSNSNENRPNMVRRLSIHNNNSAVENETLHHLRSLFLFGVGEESPVSKLISMNLRFLNVLDLQNAPLTRFPEVVVGLFHLSYLSLRKTKVKEIPKSIKKLINLQTLDLKDTHVRKLPAGIRKLKKLRHLLVYRYEVVSYADFHYKCGFKAPSKIGGLKSLRKLCFLDMSQCSHSIVKELSKLQQLTRLGITKLREKQGEPLCAIIPNLINLHALSITSISDKEIIDLNHLRSAPPHLQRLYLTGCLQELPNWISGLSQLQKLHLKWSQLKQDPIEDLKGLPELIHLELHQAYVGEELRFSANGFKNLKHLGLDKFDNLKSIDIEESAIPCLERLTIQRCLQLSEVPKGIEHLKLKLLYFVGMPDNFINKLRRYEENNVHSKIAHVPVVSSSRWNVNDWVIEELRNPGPAVAAPAGSSSQPKKTTMILGQQICWK